MLARQNAPSKCRTKSYGEKNLFPFEAKIEGVEVGKRIDDEFTHLQISRQLRWQLRRAKEGKCIICARCAIPGTARCRKHHVQQALQSHERNSPGQEPFNSKWLKLASSNGRTKRERRARSV